MNWPIALRADADSEVGAGHFMRCLTLAEGCIARGGRPVIFTATPLPAMIERASSADVEIVALNQESRGDGGPELTRWVSEHPGAWVVLDGYHFDERLQLSTSQAGARVMLIDDFPRLPRYHADIFLDQNISAEEKRYQLPPDCRTMFGPRYALLRPQFIAAREENRVNQAHGSRVLVTMGAADPDNHTLMVINALADATIPNLNVTMVVGAANPHLSSLRSVAEDAGFHVLMDVRNMARLMAEADVAVSSAGTTLWELCCMGLPTITIVIAENQRSSAVALERAGATVNLGWHENVAARDVSKAVNDLLSSQASRTRMSKVGQFLVDGQGVQRVVDELIPADD